MFESERTIVTIGAHPDDIELGCAGTIHNIIKEGGNVIAIFLTKGELSGDPAIRMNESKKSLHVLGVENVYFGDFPDAEIPTSHESISFLERFQNEYAPDMVLTHTINDTHQDHRTVGWISLSAFRNCNKILSYETPTVIPHQFAPNYFRDITSCVDLKWNALKMHKSQKEKRYLTYEAMKDLAHYRGRQVKVEAAEAFEVVKYLVR